MRRSVVLRFGQHPIRGAARGLCAAVLGIAGIIGAANPAVADERGVSFWLPGLFGSLAAAPQQPGFSLTSIYWHDDVSAGAAVARAHEFATGKIPSLRTSTSAET